ncbi:unnamed protein product [Peniophora sp. CBMAI 1063]|nr:unnamed protein product [Peniophora sp. CBMAI 1063]
MSHTTPSKIHAPKPQRAYPGSPRLARPTSPSSITPHGSNTSHRGHGSSRQHQPASRPAEYHRSPIPPHARLPSTRSQAPPSYNQPTSARRPRPPVKHELLKMGDIVLVVESAQYPLFQFIDSKEGGASRTDDYCGHRQMYLAGAGGSCREDPRPAMIVKPDADGKHTVMLLSRWSGRCWESLSSLIQYLSVEVEREGFKPEKKHLSELAVKIEGWRSEDVSYMILHSHKLNPHSGSKRGHVVGVAPYKLANSPEAVERLLLLEQFVKKAWLEKPQAERDDVIMQFFRDANWTDTRGSDTPSPSSFYRAPQVHTPGGTIIRPQMRSAYNSPAISRASSPALVMRNLL